ncbi:MAG: 16S rRNA (cytosine(1402)-N(4))-methyltransferase, partial [Anaerohalosphaera sp.]|nr:16S rRNA (cytosine(1402)-N(4))-methyltransferase [Anaerohalosphaera sp.]
MKSQTSKRNTYNKPIRAKGKTVVGTHVPVMVKEVLGYLAPKRSNVVVDCTVGYGGHAAEFLKRLGQGGKYIGLDVDGKEFDKTIWRLKKFDIATAFYRKNFAEIDEVFHDEGSDGFDIIFADIGVSSMQVDTASRGISYKADGPLDMRMDKQSYISAYDLINSLSENEISAILKNFGEERWHHRI